MGMTALLANFLGLEHLALSLSLYSGFGRKQALVFFWTAPGLTIMSFRLVSFGFGFALLCLLFFLVSYTRISVGPRKTKISLRLEIPDHVVGLSAWLLSLGHGGRER